MTNAISGPGEKPADNPYTRPALNEAIICPAYSLISS
jgi:hypothetical protein